VSTLTRRLEGVVMRRGQGTQDGTQPEFSSGGGHTALTWMADAGVELHLLQRVAGHQDPAVTTRYLHPDHQAVLDVGAAYSRWWAQSGPNYPALRLVEDGPVAG
jgi:integrase